nr:D-alanyl-D-alanine carboxypeptidase [Solirubrobacterales bacterium]
MRRLICALALLAGLVGASPATAYDEADLRAKLAREMRLAGSATGAYVRDIDSGEDLYSLRENRVRVPASVEKLYTTSAALLRLGPAATLDTVAAATGTVDGDGVLRGDLYLLGRGDPFFGARAATRLARAVRDAGIRRIAGSVIGDEAYFDRRRSGRFGGYDGDLGGVL